MRDSNSPVVPFEETMAPKTQKSDLNVAPVPAPSRLYISLVVIIYLQWLWMACLIGLICLRAGINNNKNPSIRGWGG